MSSPCSWAYTELATVWPVTGRDDYGVPTYGTPYTIECAWETGNTIRTDANGNNFVPQDVFHFEAERGGSLVPESEWPIILGDFTGMAAPHDDARKIRRIVGYSSAMFGEDELPDWEINT